MKLVTIGIGSFVADAPAADSIRRMIAAGMPTGHVTETERTLAEQITLFTDRYTVQWVGSGPYGDVRWWKGVRYVRTSGLGMAAIPGTSVHGLGNAMDCNDPMRTWIGNHPDYGWKFTIPSEPWHCEYSITRDKHLTAIPTSNSTEDIMTPAQEAMLKEAVDKVRAVYDAVFTEEPTSLGTRGGLLANARRVDDAIFKTTPTSFGTPGGLLATAKAILDKIK